VSPAAASAPNYDCLVAGGGRLAIDQWEDPHRRRHGRWLPVRTFASRGGAIRALAGWLRQTKPLVPRYPGTGSS
jgi:hypothetical protein